MKRMCATKGCKNKARDKRKLCNTCKNRLNRERHPLRYWYLAHKGNARRRNKPFTLTYEEYVKFCEEHSGYIENKGRTAQALSIDCRDPIKGYTYDNIRPMSVSNNSKLRHAAIIDPEWEPTDYCPF